MITELYLINGVDSTDYETIIVAIHQFYQALSKGDNRNPLIEEGQNVIQRFRQDTRPGWPQEQQDAARAALVAFHEKHCKPTVIPNGKPYDGNLTSADLADFASSYITPELAALAGRRVDSDEGAAIVGRKDRANYAGIIFLYYWPGVSEPREYRLRRDHPEYEYKEGTQREKNKYLSPPGRGNKLYFPPGIDPGWLNDPTIPVVFVEGEKKALALHRMFAEAGRKGLVIGLSGVWNWMGKTGIEPGPDGKRREVSGPIADLDRIIWQGREVTIIFDADIQTNPNVQTARRKLAKEISQRRGTTKYVDIPSDAGGKGIDDVLGARGPEFVLDLFAKARSSEGDLTGFNRTDAGNAEAFAYLYGDRIRYDYKRGRWLLWQGHRWISDLGGELQRMAVDACRELYAQAVTIQDLTGRQLVSKFAIQSEAKNKIDARLEMAKGQPPIEDKSGEKWDADPWLLGVANGVVDLHTGELRPGEPGDYITKRAAISYDPDAKCDLWLKFLDEIFSGDTELINFISRAVGYSLTGITTEQCLFVCHGKGSNGKSVFLNILRYILGDHAYNAPFSTFELDQRSAIPNDVAALEGRRLVVSSETNEGTRLNEARIKALTGGDIITARLLHKEFFQFNPLAKFWLAVNHLPNVKDNSDGFWRRMRLIEFKRQFLGDSCDNNLEIKLKAESSGILTWAVQHCLEWQRHGLKPPASVIQATSEYRSDSDTLAAFLEECCLVDADAYVKAGELFKAYSVWAERNSLSEREKLTQTGFGKKVKDRFEKRKGMQGAIYYGVGLLRDSQNS